MARVICVHKDCGYMVENILWESDTYVDYYVPTCPVHGLLANYELEFIQAEGAD